jgi:hypothetical protein
VEGGADLLDVGSVAANSLVELIAGDAQLFGPVGHVRSHLGVNLLKVVRAFGVIFVNGMGFMSFWRVVVLGHWLLPLFGSLRLMTKPGVVMPDAQCFDAPSPSHTVAGAHVSE